MSRIARVAALAFLVLAGCADDDKPESAKKTPYDGGSGGATNVQAALDALSAQVAALQTDLAVTQADLAATQADLAAAELDLADANQVIATLETASTDHETRVDTLETASADHETRVDTLETTATSHGTSLTALQTKTAAISTATIDTHPAVVFTGVNVYVQSGSGQTFGAATGRGNLVIGYNELRGSGDVRTGSHNLIVGTQHNYASYGGFVAGVFNEVSAPWATVSGGVANIASGDLSSISGGESNAASAQGSSISGGFGRTATGVDDWVAGALFQDN